MKAHNSHQPEGNYYDKYHSSNPIVRWMMKNFFAAFTELLQETEAVDSILEAGCGEGEVSDFLWKYYGGSCPIDAFDRSEKVIRQAAEKNADIRFFEGDIYDLARGGVQLSCLFRGIGALGASGDRIGEACLCSRKIYYSKRSQRTLVESAEYAPGEILEKSGKHAGAREALEQPELCGLSAGLRRRGAADKKAASLDHGSSQKEVTRYRKSSRWTIV